jgi:hypothetical protein
MIKKKIAESKLSLNVLDEKNNGITNAQAIVIKNPGVNLGSA